MLTPERFEISIIIVNYQSVLSLEKALCSLKSADILLEKAEIIVVNNDISEENQVRLLSERFHFTSITLPVNKGFGNAANAAASVATGKILCFLNPDVEFATGSFEKLFRFFDVHKEIGVVGGRLISKDGRPETWSAGKSHTLYRIFRNKCTVCPDRRYWQSTHSVAVEWVSGGSLFVRADLFKELAGFDEQYFLYCEDMDLCKRVREAGYTIVSFPLISFVHEGGASRASDVARKKAYYKSQDIYFHKHRPGWEGVVIRLLRFGLMKV